MPDGDPVGEAIRAAVDAGARVVLTTGGTGLTPTDRTPEVTRPLLDAEMPGIAEAIRAYGVSKGVPTAMLSRGLAGAGRHAASSSTCPAPAAGSGRHRGPRAGAAARGRAGGGQ